MPIGLRCELPDEAEPVPKVVTVHERQRQRLHDAERARVRDRRDQLGIAAGIHRAANERDLDACVGGERGCSECSGELGGWATAQWALERCAYARVAALDGNYPGAHLPGRIVTNVLGVAALEVGHPMVLLDPGGSSRSAAAAPPNVSCGGIAPSRRGR